MKNNIFISGFSLNTNNRGTQALGYGAVSFLKEHHNLLPRHRIISPDVYRNPFKKKEEILSEYTVIIDEVQYTIVNRKYWLFDIFFVKFFFQLFNVIFPFSAFGRDIKSTEFLAAICGGDGFSDIYSDETMRYHLYWTKLAKDISLAYMFLPQTIGPFEKKYNLEYAQSLLSTSSYVYIRDTAFLDELEKMNIKFEITNDLSYYMVKEHINYEIEGNSIGINISGLCYFNSFYNLKGKFDYYPLLISEIVKFFQSQNKVIYLIPHSYNYHNPELDADDLEASRVFLEKLENKSNVKLIELDLKSPQIKYLISKMKFFVGSRMHSCFAAIYTNTPVYGLGYSYKYEHNFKRYNLQDNYFNVLDMDKSDIDFIMKRIIEIEASN